MSASPAPSGAPAIPAPTSPPAPTAPPPSSNNSSAPPPTNPSTPTGPAPTVPSPPPPPDTPTPPSSAGSPPPESPATPSTPPPTPSTPSTPSTPIPSTPATPSTPSTPLPPSSGRTPSTPVTPSSGRTPSSTVTPSNPSSPGSGSSSNSSSNSSNNNNTGIIVGAAVGAVALLLVLGVIFVCCSRKKRRRPSSIPNYGPPPPPPIKDNTYGRVPQNWQHNASPPPAEYVVKVLSNTPPEFGSRPPHPQGQFASPPAPGGPSPPFMSSSGGSNYSGSENPLPPPSPGAGLGFSKSTFTFEELAMATNGFSDANLLGQGGFGYVHRGILPNGKEVAVKQLKAGSGQGEREFQAEVEIISRVHHRHLVALVGYCIAEDKRLLVYDYVPNNTLEFHLHGNGRPPMDWSARLKIALGSAKGLAYLHEDCHPKIIHRDVKAANILLDYKFEAKVADFGLAKFASDANTHVSTRVMGTFGYLAPEYASSGKLTDKSDVFSFGVMLLELITGRRPVDSNQSFMDDSLVDWARPLLSRALEDGNYDALVDPRLGKDYNPTEMARMIACAAACVRHSAKRRPRMSQVVRALEGDVSLDDLNEGIRPGRSRPFSTYGSSDYDSSQYNEDLKKFRKMAFGSQAYPTSEYSAPTSEYGQNPSVSSTEGWQTNEMEMGKLKKDGQGISGSS